MITSEELAWKIRRHGIEMTHRSGGSHIAAVLSVADIVACLYADILNVRPEEPDWPGRDRFILSKGHAGAAVYAALAERGFFPVEELVTHYANGSRLSGHVSHKIPGVDISTGSLGHGLSVGVGMALTAKQDGKSHRVFVVMGDGECDEGAVWEAALVAAHFRLDNLTAIVDRNRMQSLDFTENTLKLEDFSAKWVAFGWNVVEIDGHDHEALKAACAERSNPDGKPSVIIADTVKGKGVSFMENDVLWHYRFPHDGWEYDRAVTELRRVKPVGVEDLYTPEGIPSPATPESDADAGTAHTLSDTWKPSWLNLSRDANRREG